MIDEIDTRPAGLVPREVKERKPKHGAPCNGCGACCMVTRCDLSQHVFGLDEIGPCPALTQTSYCTYGCGLVLDPKKWAPARAMAKGARSLSNAAFLLIGGGDGCDARFNGEERNVPFAEALDAKWRSGERVKQSRRAKLLWGASK
jgi:hypothetical protein